METENKLIFDRQYKLFNPDEQKLNIIVVGCGSTGSFIILNLAKLGFNNITAIDFDKVEKENIPNQFYRFCDIDKPKVEAIKEITKDFTGLEIKTINKKIDEQNKFLSNVEIDLNTIVVFCLDNIEARKFIYDEIKGMPIKLLDTRLGGNGYQIYVIDLENENDKKEYELLLSQEVSQNGCGEKSVIYTILSIASETCNILKKIDKGESYTKRLKREMTSIRILGS